MSMRLILGIFLFVPFSLMDATSIAETTTYPQFCQKAVESDLIFQNFKRDPHFYGMLEHVTYEQGLAYLEIIRNEYPDLLSLLDQFRTNDLIGNPRTFFYEGIGEISSTTLRYIKVAGDLRKLFGDMSGMHIVEIGGAYGGQCKILADLCGFASYTIFDLPEVNALAQKYLAKFNLSNVIFYNRDDFSKVQQEYDLLISNYAFSELDKEEQNRYMSHVVNLSLNGYMTMNFISQGYRIKSFTLHELLSLLRDANRTSHVEQERPLTAADNKLLTWKTE